MTTKQILIAAKALIDTPEKWCKIGSVLAIAQASETTNKASPALYAMYPFIQPCTSLSEFCSTHTHAEVMSKFDEAIAACPDDGEEVK